VRKWEVITIKWLNHHRFQNSGTLVFGSIG
jgi:hypothetical protein